MQTNLPNRTEKKKEDTQRKIITVAVDLFNQFGLESVTMEQIAETVDIAKGTLYNYFPSKEAIINAFLQRRFADHSADWIATLHKLPDTHSRMTFVFTLLIDGVKRQRNLFEAFMVYRMKQILSFTPIEESAKTGLSLLIREIVQLGQQNNELRSDLPDMLLDELFEFALIEAIKPMYLMPESFAQEKSIRYSIDLFIRGARA